MIKHKIQDRKKIIQDIGKGRVVRLALTVLVLLSLATKVSSQNADSLKTALAKATNDTTRCKVIYELTEVGSTEAQEKCYEQLFQICETGLQGKSTSLEKKIYKQHSAYCFSHFAMASTAKGDYLIAIEYYDKCLKFMTEIGNKQEIVYPLNKMAMLYNNLGDIPRALDRYSKALTIQEEIGDKLGTANSLNNMGSVYNSQGDTIHALEYFNKSLRLLEQIGFKQGIAYCLNNIGLIYNAKKDFVKALDLFDKSRKILEEIGDNEGIAFAYNNIGFVYYNQNHLEKAMEYYNKSLEVREKLGDKLGIARTLHNIGSAYLKLVLDPANKHAYYDKALACLERSMELNRAIGFPKDISNTAHSLYTLYTVKGDYTKALSYYELYILMNDSTINTATKKATIKTQLKYEYEKKAAQDSVANAEHTVQDTIKHEEAIKQQQWFTYGGALGFLLMMVIAGISFGAYRTKQKANDIISRQKILVEHQKELVDQKQKEILDSIYYAQRIQRALITNEKYIENRLNKLNAS